MQGEANLKTVECLRGRLLAERAVSRAANENAEIMNAKLKDLEKQLKIETKSRKKAEKKLNLLKMKLESLNIIPFSIVSDESEQSSSSDHSGESCISSKTHNQQEDCRLNCDFSNSSQVTQKPDSEINSGQLDVHHSTLDTNHYGLKNDEVNEDDIDEVDNSMALVVVDPHIEYKESCNEMIEVREVLNTSKLIRLNIQSRRIITY